MDGSAVYRPTGKSLWMGKDLARSTEWIVPLPKDAIAEIDANLQRLRNRVTDLDTLDRQDFPLHSLETLLPQLMAEIATGRGFVVLRGLPVERYTVPELELIYWGLGLHFGTGLPQSFLGERIGHVMDVSDVETDHKRRRAYHSRGYLRVHTDSCDILSMLSVRAAKSGGESRLASAHTVHNLMLDLAPGLLKVMYDGFYLRMPDSDAEALGRPPLSDRRIPAYMHTDGWLNCAFVRGYITRAVEAGDIRLSPQEEAAIEVFAALGNHPDVYLDMNLRPGDMQFVNNRTIMHGRTDFENWPEKDRRRLLLRLWLTVPDWPKMSDLQGASSREAKMKWLENAKKRPALAGATA